MIIYKFGYTSFHFSLFNYRSNSKKKPFQLNSNLSFEQSGEEINVDPKGFHVYKKFTRKFVENSRNTNPIEDPITMFVLECLQSIHSLTEEENEQSFLD
jgi:hypothetical protein